MFEFSLLCSNAKVVDDIRLSRTNIANLNWSKWSRVYLHTCAHSRRTLKYLCCFIVQENQVTKKQLKLHHIRGFKRFGGVNMHVLREKIDRVETNGELYLRFFLQPYLS